MYPTEYTWIRKLTKETIHSMAAASGSISIPKSRKANQCHDCSTTPPWYISARVPADITNAANIVSIARIPPFAGSFFPKKSVSTKEIMGKSTIRYAKSWNTFTTSGC
ncbi:MAG: hypothetical protein KBONHNOK_00683 [Candidatus Methanoperedenaceae archaeon GB50]|nr:MAG: hypothetical protein KBONHNOK_00683 [Candidatus Methanoperedenaceae archaeon GB50]